MQSLLSRALALGAASAWAPALLAQQPVPAPVVPVDRIQVVSSASRVEEDIDATPATLSVIERRDIFRSAAHDLRDLVRYEPGVTVENNAARFGLGNVSIRGLDGNRVQMTLDGIRLPESYRVGSFSNASRNALGLGLLKQVEILRGPASAIHGSDALAGVLAFTTVDPSAYLRDGRTGPGEAFVGYAEADDSLGRGAVAAAAAGSTQWLFGFERQDGAETDNMGTVGGTGASRTQPNPQNTRSESQLIKGVIPVGAAWRWVLTADRFARQVHTDVLSLNPQSNKTVSLSGDDRATRTRGSVDAIFTGTGAVDRFKLTAYVQESITQQDTDEVRANTTAVCLTAPGNVTCEREVRFRYDQREAGVVAIGESSPRWGGLEHALVYGADASRLKTDERRDGRQTNLNTGHVSNVVGGEALPTRDFPLTDTDRFGVFAQDRFTALDTRLTWIPGLRYDYYRLRPEVDELFRAGNPLRPVVGLTDAAWSPKLGLLFRASDPWTLTAQLSTGFRGPPAADLNIGLTSLPAGYTVIPNPDLKPERSRGAEIGARHRGRTLDATATAYYTRYDDLIVSRAALPCPGDPRCVPGATGTFQSQNVADARIYGLEARAEWRFAEKWSVRGALSAPRGDDLQKDQPLNSVDPPRIVAGLAYESGAWGAALHLTHAWEPTRIDATSGVRFVPPAWTTVDLTAHWSPAKGVEISAGIFNLTDEKYWLWADVRGLTSVTTGFDRYTQPGRNFGVNLRAGF